MTFRPLLCTMLVALAALGFSQSALAAGGNYVMHGGTTYEQSQVKAGLDASSFNWSLVPGVIRIEIGPGLSSEATPGTVYLDSGLLDAGDFSWGVVQHEYAHQVDFALLDAAERASLNTKLGGTTWCYAGNPTLAHNQYGCERFASTLAWSFWQSPDNVMKPSSLGAESAGMAPAAFRALIATMLGAGSQVAPTVVSPLHAPVASAAAKHAAPRPNAKKAPKGLVAGTPKSR